MILSVTIFILFFYLYIVLTNFGQLFIATHFIIIIIAFIEMDECIADTLLIIFMQHFISFIDGPSDRYKRGLVTPVTGCFGRGILHRQKEF